MSRQRTLNEMCDALYEDEELSSWVREQVGKAGTESRILSGELVLPHPSDAALALRREKGIADQTPAEQRQQSTIDQLRLRLEALESQRTKEPTKTAESDGV